MKVGVDSGTLASCLSCDLSSMKTLKQTYPLRQLTLANLFVAATDL